MWKNLAMEIFKKLKKKLGRIHKKQNSVFVDLKNYYHHNIHTTQSDLQIQCDLKTPRAFILDLEENNVQIYMEIKETLDS